MKVAINTCTNRYYILDNEDKKLKMIPAPYAEIAHKLVIEDFDKKRLTLNERLQLEIMAFKERLKHSEKYVFELIERRKFSSIRLVTVKFGEDRREASFDGLHIVCSKKLFDLAHKALYPITKIKSMS